MIMRLLIALALTAMAAPATAVEIMPWKRLPLPVQLSVGHERIIFVDRNVRVGAPRSLQNSLRIQSVAGAVYLLASEQIPPSRLHLKDAESGEIILLDIATIDSGAELEPARIVFQEDQVPPVAVEEEPAGDSSPVDERPQRRKTPIPLALTRYAAQMLYAPLRTVEPLPGVRQVPVRLAGPLDTLIPTHEVSATAKVAWSLDQWYVTPVRITNRRAQRIELDPRTVQGDFYAATFQHLTLGPAGSPEDTTTLYLVTQGKPLLGAVFPGKPVAEGDGSNGHE